MDFLYEIVQLDFTIGRRKRIKEEGKTISRAVLKTELKDKYLFTDAQATYGANNAKL